MREILFRGKTRMGEWVQGDYAHFEVYGITYPMISIWGELNEDVIPETVGQYTGLTDKNGTKIFEGDIVSCNSRTDCANMVVIFECGQFRMVIAEKYYNYVESCGFYDINCFEKSVIGNIHDNPELLKGE